MTTGDLPHTAPDVTAAVGGSPREGGSAAGRRHAQVLRTVFERWARGEYEHRPGELHPDIEVVSRISGRKLQGHAGVRHWIADLNASFDSWQISLGQIHEVGETRLIAVGRVHLLGRHRSVELDQPCAFIVDFRDGQIARLEAAPNRVEEVLAVHGVPPRQ